MCKYTEAALPSHLRAQVVHLHTGNASKNQLKRIGKTNAKYVTIARLWDYDVNTDEEVCVAEGIAACSPKDNPSRQVGRAVAIGRALKEYELAHYHLEWSEDNVVKTARL